VRSVILFACLVLTAACYRGGGEDTLYVAVASNFAEPAREIAGRFTMETGAPVALSFGSTGQLFAQITQDAPFEVFLSADAETPRELVARGLGVGPSVFTYAVGQLVLYSRVLDVTNGEAVLRGGEFGKIALASPGSAPYGRAAMETLENLGLTGSLRPRLVEGTNVAQTFQFIETGAAELGFVARSQVTEKRAGSVWPVPMDLYSPILQDAVLLEPAKDDETALKFMAFLALEVDEVLIRYGYARVR
jgi:molybdate transport system substrate-binding protein